MTMYKYVYQLYCKGPFEDGRPGECAVRVGELKLNREAHPHRDLGVYRCNVCATARYVLKPYADRELIPWWDPDYRAAVISALSVAARVFPYAKFDYQNKPVRKKHFRDLRWAVETAIWPLLSDRPAPKEVSRRRAVLPHTVQSKGGIWYVEDKPRPVTVILPAY